VRPTRPISIDKTLMSSYVCRGVLNPVWASSRLTFGLKAARLAAMSWAGKLRFELAHEHATTRRASGVFVRESRGIANRALGSVGPARHENFIDESYEAILKRRDWDERLTKARSQKGTFPEDRRSAARELDSCNSSDALLTNSFCYPSAAPQIFAALMPDPGWIEGFVAEFADVERIPTGKGKARFRLIVESRSGQTVDVLDWIASQYPREEPDR
jgi:hypothetical protein